MVDLTQKLRQHIEDYTIPYALLCFSKISACQIPNIINYYGDK